jgi:hypothetical protein
MGYVRCIKNDGYKASLNIGKVYKTLPTTKLEGGDGLIRVIDNEGEDYLYDSDYFEPVEMSALTDQKAGLSALTIRVNPLTKAILQAEALFLQKSVGALVREWIDERLDLPTG